MVPVELLKKTKLAEGLTDAQVADLASYATSKQFASGETILGMEDIDYRLLVVLEGEVNVLGVLDDQVGIVKEGNLLGEISFIDHKPRSAGAIANTDVHLAEFSSDLLYRLTESDPLLEAQILYNISIVICQKLRQATKEIDASII